MRDESLGQAGQSDRSSAPRVVVDGRSAAWWVIALSLAVIAFCLATRMGEGRDGLALAQSVTRGGSRGVFAFTGQLTKNTYGVYMVDVDAGTIWVYEYVNRDSGKLRLAAGREWLYDRYLRNFNVDGPLPEEVEEIVNLERGLVAPDRAISPPNKAERATKPEGVQSP